MLKRRRLSRRFCYPPRVDMRLDIFLKLSRLEPRRTIAQQMCEAGAVSLNGSRAKSAREVNLGDEITIRRRDAVTTVRVVTLPSKPPSKAEAPHLYETIKSERRPIAATDEFV